MRRTFAAFDAGRMHPYRPQPPQYAYQPPIVVAVPPTSGVATASLVLGILGILGGWCLFGLPCIAAVILGHLGMAATRDGRRGGRGQAVAGLILGYVCVVPMIIFTLMLIGTMVASVGTPDPTPSAGFGTP